MRDKARLTIAAALFLGACAKDEKKPFLDAQQTFGETLVQIAPFTSFVRADAASTSTLSPWRRELDAYARGRIAQTIEGALQRYERSNKPPPIPTPTSRLASALGATRTSCRPKVIPRPSERISGEAAQLKVCVQALAELDAEVDGVADQAAKAGVPPSAIGERAAPSTSAERDPEVLAMQRLLEVGPAEAKWRSVRDCADSSLDELRLAAEAAEAEAEATVEGAPGGIRDVYRGRAVFAKGRKLMLMEVEKLAEEKPDDLAKNPDRAKTCARLHAALGSEELPARYRPKLVEIHVGCEGALPDAGAH